MGGAAQWAPQRGALPGLMAPDLPGFGDHNDAITPSSINALARNLFEQLDALDVQRFHLVGHSMGGMIVQEMVALAPERVDRLVLYGTGPVGTMPGRFETG